MPFLKGGDLRLQPGDFDQPCDFYAVSPVLDSAGGVVNPADSAVSKTLQYRLNANVMPLKSQELQDGERLVGDTWSTVSIPYIPSRIPKQGMRIVLALTGAELEIRGVDHISFSRQKVELSCRLLV